MVTVKWTQSRVDLDGLIEHLNIRRLGWIIKLQPEDVCLKKGIISHVRPWRLFTLFEAKRSKWVRKFLTPCQTRWLQCMSRRERERLFKHVFYNTMKSQNNECMDSFLFVYQFQHEGHAVSSGAQGRHVFNRPEVAVWRLALCLHEADTSVNGTGNIRYLNMRPS